MVGDDEDGFIARDCRCMKRVVVSEEDVEKSPAEELEEAIQAGNHSADHSGRHLEDLELW